DIIEHPPSVRRGLACLWWNVRIKRMCEPERFHLCFARTRGRYGHHASLGLAVLHAVRGQRQLEVMRAQRTRATTGNPRLSPGESRAWSVRKNEPSNSYTS